MKKAIYALLLAFLPSLAWGQESQTEYNFLRLPVSAHAAALGGENITIIEDDPSLVFSNPALAASVSDRTAGLNYMNYMSGVSYASASYTKVLAPKATVVGGVKYINYSSMKGDRRHGHAGGHVLCQRVCHRGHAGLPVGAQCRGRHHGQVCLFPHRRL